MYNVGRKQCDDYVSLRPCRHIVAVRGAASLFPDQFQQSVHSAVRAAAVRPGHITALHPPSPERQHEDVHALQNRHGQSGGWGSSEDGCRTQMRALLLSLSQWDI